ncbi:MAG: AAA family ATPase [Chloroflexi bacterium]|nr:AAA family ATPase [Chloroflexota bacterium]
MYMVDEIFQWQELDIKLSQAFSPAAAIIRSDFFRGRRTVMRQLVDVVNQDGQHAIIYGERGVGKTSLANVLSTFLEPFTSETIASARVNCYRQTTYKEIWNSLLEQVELLPKHEYNALTLYDVLDTLRSDKERKFILIVDEFDRIEDPDIDGLFADTIKTLSDFSVDTTLILVGVADDVNDLITEHESINRCLVQIHLPRMTHDELGEIVKGGIESVGMEISEDAIAQTSKLSLGLPHYVHALGLASGRIAIDNERRAIELSDVGEAIKTVINESQQTVLRQFDLATASPRRQSYYFQALLACALAPTDRLGYFRPADVRIPYSYIMNSTQSVSVIARYLHGLCEERRGAALQKLGASHSYRYRFTDPVLQPYVLMRGLEHGLLTLEDVDKMTANDR